MSSAAAKHNGGHRQSLALSARIVAATLGNYVVTSLATGLLARTWPIAPAQATMASTLLAFVIFPVIALTAFAIRSPWKLWAGLIAAAVLLGGGLWLSLASGGRL